jgi:hypothetical protein
MKKLILSFLSLSFLVSVHGQPLLSEPFNYTTGNLATQGGWSVAQGTTAPFQVISNGLTFTGYPLSGSDNAVSLAGNATDIEQETKNIGSTLSSGSLYCSFLLNVTSAPSAESIIFGFTPSTTSPTFLGGRLFIQSSQPTNLSFNIHPGLQLSSNASTGYVFSTGVTYLVVLKYTFVAGADNNQYTLFVIPTGTAIPGSEPAATLGPVTVAASSGEDMDDIDRICLIARDVAVNAKIDGIRIASSWSNLLTSTTGITKSTSASQISLYPNPSRETIHFTKSVSVELMNMEGKVLSKQEDTETIDVSSFNAGSYILKCSSGNVTEYKTIMIK